MLISLMMMVTVTILVQGQRCVNSCCQKCSTPDQCRACYVLNTNPVMCPCVGDEEAEVLQESLPKLIAEVVVILSFILQIDISMYVLIRERLLKSKWLATMMTWKSSRTTLRTLGSRPRDSGAWTILQVNWALDEYITITFQDSVSRAAVVTRHAHVTRVQCASGELCLVPGHVHVNFNQINSDFSILFSISKDI